MKQIERQKLREPRKVTIHGPNQGELLDHHNVETPINMLSTNQEQQNQVGNFLLFFSANSQKLHLF